MSVGFRFRHLARSDEIFGIGKLSALGSGEGLQMTDQGFPSVGEKGCLHIGKHPQISKNDFSLAFPLGLFLRIRLL